MGGFGSEEEEREMAAIASVFFGWPMVAADSGERERVGREALWACHLWVRLWARAIELMPTSCLTLTMGFLNFTSLKTTIGYQF